MERELAHLIGNALPTLRKMREQLLNVLDVDVRRHIHRINFGSDAFEFAQMTLQSKNGCDQRGIVFVRICHGWMSLAQQYSRTKRDK